MNYFVLIIYFIISGLIRLTPKFASKILARMIARLVWLFTPKVRNVIVKNLSHFTNILSPEQALKRNIEIYRRFAYYIILLVKNNFASKEEILSQISEFKNAQEFIDLINKGEKIVFTTAHFSNWELLPSAVALKFNCKISVVGRALKYPSINKRLVQARQRHGVELIDKNGAIKGMLAAAKANRLIGLVSDQDAHINESVVLKINSYKVTQSKSAALMASKLNAYLVPVYIYPDGKDGFIIEFFPAKKSQSIEELSEYQLRSTQKMFEKYWEEYFWFHKRFKTFYEDEY